MAEIWAAAVATVGSAYLSSRSASRGQQQQIAADREAASRQAHEERRTMQYGAELQDYQDRLGRERRLGARYRHIGKKPPPSMLTAPKLPEQIIDPPRKK